MFAGFPTRSCPIGARDNHWLRLTGDDHRQVQSVRWSVAMRRLLMVAAMCGVATGAQAADMPDLPFLRGSYTEGLSRGSVNWAGFYAGGHVSKGAADMDFTNSTRDLMTQLVNNSGLDATFNVSQWPLLGKAHAASNTGYGAFA